MGKTDQRKSLFTRPVIVLGKLRLPETASLSNLMVLLGKNDDAAVYDGSRINSALYTAESRSQEFS